jgi:teichuronic acid biosynthesis glycosyltransferase TuaG
MPKVSIVVPVFNGEKFLGNFFNSILTQTLSDFEVLLCDDKSSDGSATLIQRFMDLDSRVNLIINDVNIGAAKSRNKCIEVAKGRYIAFCDVDDTWSVKKLEVQISKMEKYNSCISFTNANIVTPNGLKFGSREFLLEKCNLDMMLRRNYVICSSVVYDTRVIGKQFFPEIRYAEDYALWLKILSSQNTEFLVISECLVNYTKVKGSESSNKLGAVRGHLAALSLIRTKKLLIPIYMLKYLFLTSYLYLRETILELK